LEILGGLSWLLEEMVWTRMVISKKERMLFVDEMDILCMYLDGGLKRDRLQEQKQGEIVMFCVNVFDWPSIFAMKALTIPDFPIRKSVWEERLGSAMYDCFFSFAALS
jgi:hypothetical protein